MLRIALYVVVMVLCGCSTAYGNADDKFEKWKRGVVSITNQVIKSPYHHTGEFYGSGFVIDKRRGIIATNKHVVSNSNINETFVTFYNGREAKARLIYSDPQHDFSFLEVLPKNIPDDIAELSLAGGIAKINEPVTIIGNNEGQGFSIQNGIITSVFEISNHFPDQTIRISLNTRGGSSGSPIINSRGEVIAINYSTDNTYAYALSSPYLIDAYNQVLKGHEPRRRDIGAILGYYSLDKAVRALNFPESQVASYVRRFPNSLNKTLIVNAVLPSTPAEGVLLPSDIIWEIEGKPVGPNLYNFQSLLDQSQSPVSLTIYRNGQLLNVKVNLYLPKETEITRMLSLDNAILFEADEYIRFTTGAPVGSVFIVNVERNSSLSNIETIFIDGTPTYAVQVVKINNKEIKSLDDVVNMIPELKQKQDYIMYYRNYVGQNGYDRSIYINRMVQFQEIRYSPYDTPTLYTYDPEKKFWGTAKLGE